MPNQMFRAERTTRNNDDLKVLLVGTVCTLAILLGTITYPRLLEQRWYRDAMRLTPFYDTVLMYSSVAPDETITFGGGMTKRRCTFHNLYGYVYMDDGLRYRLPVDTSSESGVGNRPPSSDAENWGPWVLDLADNGAIPLTAAPVRFEVIAEHIKCPTEPTTQRNHFIGGDWTDFILVTEEAVEVINEIEE